MPKLDNVIRAPDGVPVAWRLLRMGQNPLNYGGKDLTLELTPEAALSAMEYHKTKGQKVPLDSRHFLYHLADKLHVPEADVRKMMPETPGTFGFGDLESRTDGLWLTNIEYAPLGRELMKERVFRYFSPGLRGIDPATMTPITGAAGDNFRVTSVALENEPALNDIPSLTDSEPDAGTRVTLSAINHSIRRLQMTKLEQALARLLGKTSVALAAEGGGDVTAAADAVNAVADLLNQVKTALSLGPESTPEDIGKALTSAMEKLNGGTELVAKLKAALGLPAEATGEQMEGAALGAKRSSETNAALSARLQAIETERETGKRDGLIEEGLRSGKLTKAQAENWAKTQTSAALSAFLTTAPVVVDLTEHGDNPPERPTGAPLSANERKIYETLGLTEEEQKGMKHAE